MRYSICLLLLLFFGCGGILHAQIPEGKYSGILKLEPAAMGMDSALLQLEVRQIDDSTWIWKSHYDNLLSKNYTLRLHNGHYFLDENNGILLPGKLDGNELVFLYTVDSTIYTVRYCWTDNQMHLDLRYYRLASQHNEDGFLITGYWQMGRQYAVLNKEN